MKRLLLAAAFSLGWLSVHAEPSITIYNQNFGVIRQSVPLKLEVGLNDIEFLEATAHLESDSVILRDPEGKVNFSVVEQSYRSDPVSLGLLLQFYEGKEIEFLVKETNKPDRVVKGKIVRSGYVPAAQTGRQGYRWDQAQGLSLDASAGIHQPIIEVDGTLQFTLPGQPLFPSLGDDTILKPSLNWKIISDQAANLSAELCYVTQGMSWDADYNLIFPQEGTSVDLTAWVTMSNRTGRDFLDTQVQLIAGDVAKEKGERNVGFGVVGEDHFAPGYKGASKVSQQAFDEYHLYTLPFKTTLRDRESKQIEFARATGVESQTLYIYDGAFINQDRYRGWSYENIRRDESYGTQSNPKVWVMREFENTEDNSLGIPLPKGKVRTYRRDDRGRLQFVGEALIDHTPRGEQVRIYTGNSFDLVGKRKRTAIERNRSENWLDETFEITVSNRKEDESVEIRVVEHLYRWTNWEIKEHSNSYLKTDSQTMEFLIPLSPGEEKTISYTVHYSW